MTFSHENEPAHAPDPTAETGPVSAARATLQHMVWPGGCAWHEVQTHESLIPFLIEETAEFIDAVEQGLPAEDVAEELGDVLYQVLFHAALGERDGEGYDLDSVAARLNEKLIARHPHVFGDRGYMTVDELHAEWERLKEDAAGERRGSRSALEGIPAGMPTLARSAKVVERLKRAGLLEVSAGPQPGAGAGAEDELGEALLALVIEANAAGIDPDRALRLATARLAEGVMS
jgi:uncharacterized protein YabN with tetrapyrrole methylase and pyrophosphatase domain